LPESNAKHVTIRMDVQDRHFECDAALWSPDTTEPTPLIIGLDFLGPIGTGNAQGFPIDPNARVFIRPEHGGGHVLHDGLHGKSAHAWPIQMLLESGHAVLLSCYGSWAPDSPAAFETHGLGPFLDTDTGALSLWAWAILRMIDAAQKLPDLDATRITVAGHSRLGKAALWAGACDPRIGTVFANNAGAAGSAPARHLMGETLAEMHDAFPHWIKPQLNKLPVDQNELMACIAPRRLYIGSANEDSWADPIGTYLALKSAASAWGINTLPDAQTMWDNRRLIHDHGLGHHIRPGTHALTLEDWQHFLRFLKHSE
jgi:hypothetical protein